MPQHANPIHTIFGGVVMGQIDMVASLVAERHSGRPAVTAHVSDISFRAPIRVGDHCRLMASLNFVGKTSMAHWRQGLRRKPQDLQGHPHHHGLPGFRGH